MVHHSLHIMAGGIGEPPLQRDCHHLEGVGVMEDQGSNTLGTQCGKFQDYGGM